MKLHMLDRLGRQAYAELVFRLDTVELRLEDRIVGITNRDTLRQWLAEPQGNLVYDEMGWWSIGLYGIGLHIDGAVPMWPLEDHIVQAIKERV